MMKKITQNGNYGFFSKMLLLCTALLMAFAILASIIVGYLSHQYEKAQLLKNYDLAMVNLSEAFHNRFSSLHIIAGKVLSNSQCNPDLVALLEAPSYDDIPANIRNNCITLLTSICGDDQYLRGFLIYAAETEQLYYYTDSKAYLSYADTLPPIPDLKPYAGTKLDNASLESMIAACTGGKDSGIGYYGFATTLYKTPSNPLGYLIPLFSTSEFENILANYHLAPSSTFRIAAGDGSVFFESYAFADHSEHSSYLNTLGNDAYQYKVSYALPKLSFPKSKITYIIVIFAVIVTLFSFVLYYLFYYLSNRNINHILDGMKKFSTSNLAYRIPVLPGRNEFTHIIEGFNDMCIQLQRNVERSYVYELQQKKSELYALQTSINPHFLYNTLEMIRNQILHATPDTASQMILLLSKIYRNQTNTNMFVTLEDEVELCENLMILYQYRFQNFDYEFLIDNAAECYALPKNTLQPLIENYFVHGIIAERQDNLFLLNVSTQTENDCRYVHLTLCNNGNPIAPERVSILENKLKNGIYTDKETDGFALTNVYNRLRIVFQDKCRMSISPGEGDMHFQISLTFPAYTLEQLKDSFI